MPTASDFGGTALRVDVAQQSFDEVVAGLIDRRFADTEVREQLTIGGKRAFRLQLAATGEGLDDRGTRTYGYVIARAVGPPVLVTTSAPPGERIRHRDVVDRAAQTMRVFEPQMEAATGLPDAVQQTHASLLAAAEAHDEDALRALIDEEQFAYTFGDEVPGGPLAYWESLEAADRRGSDRHACQSAAPPVRALAWDLRLAVRVRQGARRDVGIRARAAA